MLAPLVSVGLTLVFIVYVIVLAVRGKLHSRLKSDIYPGIFFISTWLALYFLLFY